jgi:hypothetical protein
VSALHWLEFVEAFLAAQGGDAPVESLWVERDDLRRRIRANGYYAIARGRFLAGATPEDVRQLLNTAIIEIKLAARPTGSRRAGEPA